MGPEDKKNKINEELIDLSEEDIKNILTNKSKIVECLKLEGRD